MDGRLSDKQVARTIKAFAVRLGLDASTSVVIPCGLVS
jgi:hypothetical protein